MQNINPDTLDLQIDTENSRIFFNIKGHRDAELYYELHTERSPVVMEFTDTFVPEQLRNIGIGARLAERGMRLAQANDYQVIASCPFVEHYLEHHPEFQHLRAEKA